jgi:hypothetical protein
MAISDPTTGVPTPTGILQGVAAFNWDGTAWQPAGRAGPSVATPTGNLQGVAAFSGGPSWAPAGRAGPGVATPTGVLDGVAVCTWSGSQWTPLGGTETVPTPTGGLRGVAAFDWDGTAWQPAAQARSSVPTPYGVLDGVARFGWTGTAWAAVGAPSLSLDFMTPGALDPRITFTRASTATYTDQNGTIQTAAINAPRWDYRSGALQGVMIEESRTNTLFPSVPDAGGRWPAGGLSRGGSITAPDNTTSTTSLFTATDTTNSARNVLAAGTAVSAVTTYSISVFLKRGPNNAYIQVNITGASTAAPVAYYDLLNGTAVVGADVLPGATGLAASILTYPNGWYRAVFTVTTNAGATGISPYIGPCVTVSATGDNRSYVGVVGQGLYAWGAQCEQGAFPTSHIPTTSASVTRAQDIMTMPLAAWYSGTAGTWFVDAMLPANGNTGYRGIFEVDGGVGNIWLRAYVLAGTANITGDVNTTSVIFGTMTPGTPFKIAATYSASGTHTALNGVLGTGTAAVSTPATYTTLRLGVTDSSNGNPANGYLRRVQYWPRVLSDAEMQSVTA